MRFEWQDVEQRYRADEDGYTVPILAPDGTPYTCPNGDAFTITIAGPSSLAAQVARTATAHRFAQFVSLGADGEPVVTVPEPFAATEAVIGGEVDLLSRTVTRWTLTIGENGNSQPVPCTVDNARVLLTSDPDIRRQLREADAARRATFRGGAPDADSVRDVARDDTAPDAGRQATARASERANKDAGRRQRKGRRARATHAAADA